MIRDKFEAGRRLREGGMQTYGQGFLVGLFGGGGVLGRESVRKRKGDR